MAKAEFKIRIAKAESRYLGETEKQLKYYHN